MAIQTGFSGVGRHLIGDLNQCDKEFLLTLNKESFAIKLSGLIKKYGFTELGSYYYDFQPGTTGVVCLAESHVSFHTWPAEGYVSLDVYTCNYTRDNSTAPPIFLMMYPNFLEPKKSSLKISPET